MSAPDYDVAIIGGGPAGSAMGAYLAKAGVTCVIFERELFPRPHVGESLVPSSTRVFRELGFLEQMETSGFPRKYGAAWTTESNPRFYDTHRWDDLGPDSEVSIRCGQLPVTTGRMGRKGQHIAIRVEGPISVEAANSLTKGKR